MGEQQDSAADSVTPEAQEGSVILEIASLGMTERGESFGEENRGALDILEITGRCFDRSQRLQLVQVVLQVIREKVDALH